MPPGVPGCRARGAGVRLAVDGLLDPLPPGQAAAAARHDPQVVRKVWHCLARFGR
ncbi:hypothetical protein GXW82_18895 [Streptacidiphilus sp. 4-A2]|nr:hypothetical protein [Streptacidiphilus sp. 4-A2]